MIKKLAAIADELDASGSRELADRIDSVIDELHKEAAGISMLNKRPEWMAAAKEALPLLDQASAIFTKHKAADSGLEYVISNMKLILGQGKK